MRKNLFISVVIFMTCVFAADTAQAGNAVWKGTVDGTWDTNTLNWTRNSVANQAYVEGDAVTFDDTATIKTVSSGGAVSPFSVLVTNTATYTISAAIVGAGGLTKSGAGTLTISGANTYSGKTTISVGTLTVTSALTGSGVAGPLGAPAGANGIIDIYSGATLYINPVGDCSTDRGLNLAGGSGTVSLYNKNNGQVVIFNGAVTVSGTGSKTLAIYNGTGGAPGGDSNVIVFNESIPDVADGSKLSLSITYNTQTAPGGSYVSLAKGGTFTGPITLTRLNGSTLYLTIGGRYDNDYGAITSIVGSGALCNGNYTNTISLAASTVLNYQSSATQTLSGAISGAGSLLMSGPGALTLTATNTYTGTTTINAGKLFIGGAGNLGSDTYANTISIGASSIFCYSSTANQAISGVISGSGALIKNNTGTLNLAGPNSYIGTTTISNGTLLVNASLNAASLVTVASGGTLGGTGTVGNVTSSGTISPGYSGVMGTLTTSNLVLNSGCTNVFDLDGTNTGDRVTVNGALTINGVPAVMVNLTNAVFGTYPLLIVSGTATNTVPTLRLVSEKGVTGRLTWGGPGNKTLSLSVGAAGTVLVIR